MFCYLGAFFRSERGLAALDGTLNRSRSIVEGLGRALAEVLGDGGAALAPARAPVWLLTFC